MNQNLLTVDELADILRTPRSWIYGKTRLKGKDQIPVVRVGKYCRFRLDDVLDWLKKQDESDK